MKSCSVMSYFGMTMYFNILMLPEDKTMGTLALLCRCLRIYNSFDMHYGL